jgi:hypothetical protein
MEHDIVEILVNKTHKWFTLMNDSLIFTLKTEEELFRY